MLKLTLFILSYVLLSQTCIAQGPEDEKSVMLYLESIAMPKKGAVCSARLEGFISEFDPAYAKWKDAKAPLLAQGEAFLRAEAARTGMDFKLHVALVTDIAAKSLGSAPQSILKENCDDLLRILNVHERK